MNKMKILFVCTHNSCRSQMAEGWAKSLYPALIDAQSAGTKKSIVDPVAITVMLESGVDISSQESKTISNIDISKIDEVITLCDQANQECPVFPHHIKHRHFSIDDPQKYKFLSENEMLTHYRQVRDEIKNLVLRIPSYRKI